MFRLIHDLLFLTLLFAVYRSSPVALAGPPPDRFVSDMFVFIGKHTDRPVRLVLNFSRGTSDREQHTYAAECTGHLVIDSAWTHLGPGRYECPETTLAVIPEGAGLTVYQPTDSLACRIDFDNPLRPFRLTIECLDFVFDATADPDYLVWYDSGPGTLDIGGDTIPGTVIHSRRDFTGYNRLAGNTLGDFPGRYEFAALAGDDGTVFLFSSDLVARLDLIFRVNTNFAACRLPDGEMAAVRDSISVTWPIASDSLYPGKPIPQVWAVDVGGQSWTAQYIDQQHFFYFTGFGLFAVSGTVEFNGTRYDVAGVVEHIHARNTPR